MDNLIERLNEYGADTEGAMERFLNDTELYESCLTILFEDPAFQALGEALAEGDVHKAFECAHMLKGVSANMGLVPLTEQIARLVEPLRAGRIDGLQEPYQAMLRERQRAKTFLG